ncbi:sensor histidine kinase [Pontibacter anaerobius]|uniref:Histidine kinase n=1 Tax=Pontibacter anaerobius TaxID=2993940 RepID=A0ABT3RJ17_9BACT|nr:histidine kinase [Pontibacter anaerobius]MCX2741800.1 histidine kinase [Pontibacter anaerobius]
MQQQLNLILKRIGIAALTTVLFFYMMVFIHTGSIWIFQKSFLTELSLIILFLLALFWALDYISQFFGKGYGARINAWLKPFVEGATVILVANALNAVFILIPYLTFVEGFVMDPMRVRLGFVVSTIASLFFYYFVERERSKKQLQEQLLRSEQLQKESFKAQLESLKSQVNPHFLFNSLNVLGSLIYKDPDQAAQFLGQLSEVYRSLLDNGQKTLVPLRTELELANAYIYLMKTRFGDKVVFEVEVPQESLPYEVPPSAVQMLLENAIKHNGSTSQKPLRIRVYTSDITLVVENNLQPRREDVKSTKTGLENIRKRYALLTDRQLEISQTGSEFIVKLPLLEVEKYENSYY